VTLEAYNDRLKIQVKEVRKKKKYKFEDVFLPEERQVIHQLLENPENANIPASVRSTWDYVSDKLQKEYISKRIIEKLRPRAWELYKSGWIYIHKLSLANYVPYCIGFDALKIMKKGLITLQSIAKPAKHLDTAVDHLAHFCFCASTMFSGAISLNNFALALAPFIKKEGLTYRQVKQQLQRFCFNISRNVKQGAQDIFLNITLGIEYSEEMLKKIPVYYAGHEIGTAYEFLDEAMIITKALLEVLYEGDALGRPFAFPIINFHYLDYIPKRLQEYGIYELFWKYVAELGNVYFIRDDVSKIRSMCCRLTLNLDDLKGIGLFGNPDNVGSIGYVTINMARIGMLMAHEEKYGFDKLLELLEEARQVLMIFRSRYEYLWELGMHNILDHYGYEPNPLKPMFNTIAICGHGEAIAIAYRDPYFWQSELNLDNYEEKSKMAINLMQKILKFILDVLKEFTKEDQVLYNLEQAPAETASIEFAVKDWEKIPELRPYIPRSKTFTGIEHVFYTSQTTPPYTTWSLDSQLKVEQYTQPLFTGGKVKHLFVFKPVEPLNLAKFFEEYIFKEFAKIDSFWKIESITWSPNITICLNCSFRTVETVIDKCPRCGSEKVENWSRIVGYYRPVIQYAGTKKPLIRWQLGRQAELTTRKSII